MINSIITEENVDSGDNVDPVVVRVVLTSEILLSKSVKTDMIVG